jgi:cytochrome c peroxidase
MQLNQSLDSIISERQNNRLIDLKDAINELEKQLNSDHENYLTAYKKLRYAYKQWEYLGEYKYPEMIKDHINGAPLPKIEKNSFSANILQPKGLQVIDELIAEDQDDSVRAHLKTKTLELKNAINNFQSQLFYFDYEIFEAQRKELLRIFTLGITGFDTPGSQLAIPDALAAVSAMYYDFTLYLPSISTKDADLAAKIKNTYNSAIQTLSQSVEFESFDRLKFLTSFIQPLYKDLKSAQLLLEIEFPNEVRNAQTAWNYNSDYIFSDDFLVPGFYSGIPEKFKNSITQQLGEYLFFDPILSANNKRACASCHDPAKAFTDGNDKSIGYDFNGTVNRNSPTLINCIYSEKFFHDLRAEALEDQMEHVVTDAKEFNTRINSIIEKLQESAEYRQLFDTAFNAYEGNKINPQTLSFAISAYVGSLRSFNSPFDKFTRGENLELSSDAKAGFNLFMGKAACGTCHFAPAFSGLVPPEFRESESEVLGIPVAWPSKHPQPDLDKGRADSRLKEMVPFYQYSFKTPTVRNISFTAPYMHNGGIKTLEYVMDFYNKGGGNGIGLNFEYQTLSSDPLKLSKKEIKKIIAFMNSLGDMNSFNKKPSRLPLFENNPTLNIRPIGGEY